MKPNNFPIRTSLDGTEEIYTQTGGISEKFLLDDVKDYIADAAVIDYDNSISGLSGTTVQDAIDELDSTIDNLDASGINYSNTTSGLLSSTVQGAIDELAAFDSDAKLFIVAADYALTSYKKGLNNLVIALKEANLWTKMTAIYPFLSDGVNQTRAYQLKYNLKNPVDSDAAYRLTFFGGITYTGTGVFFGGVNGYANTHLMPNAFNQDSIHMSIYSLTNTQTTVNDMGSIDNPITSGAVLLVRDASNNFSFRLNQATANSVSNTTSLGFYAMNRTASNVVNAWRNSTKIINQTTASAAPNSFDIYIGARNDAGSATLYSNREYSFATIGSGLTDDELGNLSAIVQTFMYETGRVVYRYV